MHLLKYNLTLHLRTTKGVFLSNILLTLESIKEEMGYASVLKLCGLKRNSDLEESMQVKGTLRQP